MSERNFLIIIAAIGLGFSAIFGVTVLPLLLRDFDPFGAIAAGFVNPFSSGFALDTLSSWLVLSIWIVYETRARGIRHGWISIVLGIVPGTVTGLASYLIIRTLQSADKKSDLLD